MQCVDRGVKTESDVNTAANCCSLLMLSRFL